MSTSPEGDDPVPLEPTVPDAPAADEIQASPADPIVSGPSDIEPPTETEEPKAADEPKAEQEKPKVEQEEPVESIQDKEVVLVEELQEASDAIEKLLKAMAVKEVAESNIELVEPDVAKETVIPDAADKIVIEVIPDPITRQPSIIIKPTAATTLPLGKRSSSSSLSSRIGAEPVLIKAPTIVEENAVENMKIEIVPDPITKQPTIVITPTVVAEDIIPAVIKRKSSLVSSPPKKKTTFALAEETAPVKIEVVPTTTDQLPPTPAIAAPAKGIPKFVAKHPHLGKLLLKILRLLGFAQGL